MEDNKWKTQPCKDCIIKTMCRKRCFELPAIVTMSNYINKNKLRSTCLSCGSEDHRNIIWACPECYGRI